MNFKKILPFVVDLLKGKAMNIPSHWKHLTSMEDLKESLQLSHEQPVLIFKHSTSCGISASAKYELVEGLSDFKEATVYYLDLLAYRNVSNAIADQLGVTHQSPQVILVKNGEAQYSSSHMAIQSKLIKEAIA